MHELSMYHRWTDRVFVIDEPSIHHLEQVLREMLARAATLASYKFDE